MTKRVWHCVLAVGVVAGLLGGGALPPGLGQASPVLVGVVAELTGPGATVGANWRDGVLLAVKEINAHGGILGHPVRTTVLDTETQPPVAAAAMRRIAGDHPFVVMGPVYSSSTLVAMKVLQEASIPEFVGSEDDRVVREGNPYIFLTSYTAGGFMQQFTRWIVTHVRPRRVAIIYSNDAFGKSTEASFVADMKPYGVPIVADVATAVGQADFTGELTRIAQAKADTLFVTSHAPENARIVKQIRTLGLSVRIVGASTLMSSDTLQLAGEALDGAAGIVQEESVAPPFRALAARFKAAYGRDPSHDAIKGYLGMQVAKVVATRVKSLEGRALAAALRGITLTPQDDPGILMPLHYNEDGSLDSEAFSVRVAGGQFTVTGQIPPLHPALFVRR
jgi:branched-chain amino acid transport system substrate-binding protein